MPCWTQAGESIANRNQRTGMIADALVFLWLACTGAVDDAKSDTLSNRNVYLAADFPSGFVAKAHVAPPRLFLSALRSQFRLFHAMPRQGMDAAYFTGRQRLPFPRAWFARMPLWR